MKSLVSSALQLLLAATACLSSNAHAKCAHDNCYRALFPTGDPARLSSALSFCSSYTAATATATTGFPTRFASPCQNSPSRFSSACSCAPTATPTPNPCDVGIVRNGGFECGIKHWTVTLLQRTSTYALYSPGNAGSAHAFFASQGYPLESTGDAEVRLVQNTTVVPGQAYIFSFASYFSDMDAGFIGLRLNGGAALGRTVDARDNSCCGTWTVNNFEFTSQLPELEIRFENLFGHAGAVQAIDDVKITKKV